jgi:hypothetical protein
MARWTAGAWRSPDAEPAVRDAGVGLSHRGRAVHGPDVGGFWLWRQRWRAIPWHASDRRFVWVTLGWVTLPLAELSVFVGVAADRPRPSRSPDHADEPSCRGFPATRPELEARFRAAHGEEER